MIENIERNIQHFDAAKLQFFSQYFYKKTSYELTTSEFSRIAIFIAFTLIERDEILDFIERIITREAVYSNILSKMSPSIEVDEDTTEVLRFMQIFALRGMMVNAVQEHALNVLPDTFDQETKKKVVDYLENGDIDKQLLGVAETLKKMKQDITGQKSYFTREEAMDFLRMKSTSFNKFRKYAGIKSAGRNGTYTLEQLQLVKEAQLK